MIDLSGQKLKNMSRRATRFCNRAKPNGTSMHVRNHLPLEPTSGLIGLRTGDLCDIVYHPPSLYYIFNTSMVLLFMIHGHDLLLDRDNLRIQLPMFGNSLRDPGSTAFQLQISAERPHTANSVVMKCTFYLLQFN